MLRKLMPLLLLAPLAARAQTDWGDGQWSGDDEYSWQSDAPSPGDPRDGYAPQEPYGSQGSSADPWGSQQQYGPSGDYGSQQYGPPEGYGSGQYGPPDPYAGAGPSMDDFRSGLDRYGRWVDSPEYGWVWQPTQVSYRWQPYWDGRWVWTTAGWTWLSDEPWGWATYHYGRWTVLDGVGWIWLPGRVWGPAWVAWRWGGGYAGWCPLGPRGAVHVQPRTWVFVETPYFLAPVRHHAVPIGVVATVWSRARPMPTLRPSPRAGPPPRIVEQHTRVPIRAVPLVEATSRAVGQPLASGAVPVWRPRTVPYSRPAAPAWSGTPARAQPARPVAPLGDAMRGRGREQFPAQQPPPPRQAPPQRAPAVQPARPASPGGASGRPVDRDARPPAQPRAQPLHEALELERK